MCDYSEDKELDMEGRLPSGFSMRPATKEDVGAILELMKEALVDQIGEGNEVRSAWQFNNQVASLEKDTRVVVAPGGAVVGCAAVVHHRPHVHVKAMGCVEPAYQGRGIGTALAQWVEARARAVIPQAAEGARVVVQQEVLSTDQPATALLGARGYDDVRPFERMVIEMDGPPPAPVLPEGISIREFEPGEEYKLLVAIDQVFEDHWGHIVCDIGDDDVDGLKKTIAEDPDCDTSLWFVAADGDDIAGVSMSYPRVIEDPQMGYIWLLGVRREWRRKGLGMALLHRSFSEFYRRGVSRVSLSVDGENLTGATRLYRRGGMRPAREYRVFEKELRAGRELSTQTLGDAS